jgi:hypothetical protein
LSCQVRNLARNVLCVASVVMSGCNCAALAACRAVVCGRLALTPEYRAIMKGRNR